MLFSLGESLVGSILVDMRGPLLQVGLQEKSEGKLFCFWPLLRASWPFCTFAPLSFCFFVPCLLHVPFSAPPDLLWLGVRKMLINKQCGNGAPLSEVPDNETNVKNNLIQEGSSLALGHWRSTVFFFQAEVLQVLGRMHSLWEVQKWGRNGRTPV